VQHAVGGRAQQQLQAVPAVAAHHDQVHTLLLGDPHDLVLGRPELDEGRCLGDTEASGELRDLGAGELDAPLVEVDVLGDRDLAGAEYSTTCRRLRRAPASAAISAALRPATSLSGEKSVANRMWL
jgi:hypothetical protein